MESVFLLETLKILKASEIIQNQEAYLWDYCSESLVLTSRTTLACLQEKKFFKLLLDYDRNEKAIEDFLQFVHVSFLAHTSAMLMPEWKTGRIQKILS